MAYLLTLVSPNYRWAGIVPMLAWTSVQKAALKKYGGETPEGCAVNDDGSSFKDHVLTDEEYIIVGQLVSPGAHCPCTVMLPIIYVLQN